MNADKADTRPALTPHVATTSARGRRVLVMHGDEEIRRLIAISLTLEGFEVVTAASGQDCLDKARAAAPDIFVTTSVNTCERGECGTARQLRRYLANARIKVLLINSALEPEDDPAAGTAIDACLSAPFDPAEMIRTVRKLAETSSRTMPSPSWQPFPYA